jgi:hypothetical protein
VQDGQQQQGDRLVEVDQLPDLRMLHDRVGLAQVALDGRGVVAGQQGAAVGHHHGVVVDVDDPDRGRPAWAISWTLPLGGRPLPGR